MERTDGKGNLLDGSVLQQWLLDSVVKERGFGIILAFEFPCILSLVMQQLWVVVSLIEIFEHSGKDFG
jgi:hypothetical protein